MLSRLWRLLVERPPARRAAILALVCLPLSAVPLIGTLGYFSSLILAPLLSVMAVAIGVDAVTASKQAGDSGLRSPLGRGLGELRGLWALAVALLLVGMLWNRNCSPLAGLGFFAVGPVCSSVIGLCCGIGAACVVHRESRRLRIAVGLIPFFACLVVELLRLYIQPVVFAFDPFWGHFSGPIYDEAVSVGRRYLHYRLYNLMVTAAGMGVLHALVERDYKVKLRFPAKGLRRLALAWGVLGLCAGGFILSKAGKLRFTASLRSLDDVLSVERRTDHFIIHARPNSPAARDMDLIALESEFAYDRVKTRSGTEPDTPLHLFVFDDPKQKRRFFGAGKVEVSLPWKGQIYITYRPFPHQVFQHELVHAFQGAMGDSMFGLSSIGLVEGVANAWAPQSSYRLDLHDQAAVLDRVKKRPPLSAIMGLGFWSNAAARAYTAAGSFCLWLDEQYGSDKLAEVYGNRGDFETTYGKPLAELEGEWLAFLRARPISEQDVDAMRQRFARRSIFRRPCAQRSANLGNDARDALADGRFDDAIDNLDELCRLEPDRPKHQLGKASALVQTGDFEGAHDAIDEAKKMKDLTPGLLATISERRGDVALREGDYPRAARAFDKALGFPIGEARRRALQIKAMAAAEQDEPEVVEVVIDYFQPLALDSAAPWATVRRLHAAERLSAMPGWDGVGRYLLALQLRQAGEADEAERLLSEVVDLDDPHLTDEIRRAAGLERLIVLTMLGRYDDAQAQLHELVQDPAVKSGDLQDYELWRKRLAYFSTRDAR